MDYHQSVVIEETVTLEASDNYTVNVTVFVRSYAGLGSHTNITEIGEPIEHNIIANSTTIILFIQTPTSPLHLLMKVNKSTSLTSILYNCFIKFNATCRYYTCIHGQDSYNS